MLPPAALFLPALLAVSLAPPPHVSLEQHRLRVHQTTHPAVVDVDTGEPLDLTPGEHHTRVPGTKLQHRQRARFVMRAYGRDFDLVLKRSDELLGGNFAHVSTSRNKTSITRRHQVDHCYYHGMLADEPGSQVVAHTCSPDGIETSIRRHEPVPR